MGASSSCQMFESFSSVLQWIINSKFNVKGVSHLLVDCFFVGKADTSECLSSLNTFLSLADSLGIPITAEKTQYPTTMITIYGIEIDSIEMVARLSVNKVEKKKLCCKIARKKGNLHLKELQSLLRLLNFACGVIVPGRAFLRRLFDLIVGHTCHHWNHTEF